jgi:DNA-binding PadR family transcriptional regulator
MSDPRVDSFLPLAPADLQLLLATMAEPLHGYAMMKAVETQSRGALRVELGSLYRMIQRLEREGVMEQAPTPAEGPAPGRERRYYRITAFGRAVVAAELSRLRAVLDLAGEVRPGEAR